MIKNYDEWMSDKRDSYLMDLENEILDKYGFHFTKLKKERINNIEWLNLIKRYIDTGVYETEEAQNKFIEYYKIWVHRKGGDDFFH